MPLYFIASRDFVLKGSRCDRQCLVTEPGAYLLLDIRNRDAEPSHEDILRPLNLYAVDVSRDVFADKAYGSQIVTFRELREEAEW